MKFLASVAEFAEILRESPWSERSSLHDVLELAKANASGEEQREFVRLVENSLALRKH
ncbi:DUF3520 domain-containing protein [Brevibacillus agri]|uniref:YfbK domain-containing protein n=1 Tax=Brevibacillus agri TaxID=51101 RepID=UPI002E232566|nr:DUF3520 domain-containing protein [Brevibacillus agri]